MTLNATETGIYLETEGEHTVTSLLTSSPPEVAFEEASYLIIVDTLDNDTLDNTNSTYSFDNTTLQNDSYVNTTSEYDYDYDAAIKTFFWGELLPPLVVYSIIYIMGVVGNVLILFTIGRYKRLKTTTNVFLASLASADLLLILICIPVKLARLFSYTWTLGEITCKTLYYLQALSALCSVLTLTTMSVERYYAIVYPMRAQYRCTISQAKKFCAGIWCLAIVLATPTVILQVHMEVGHRITAYWCVRDFDSPFNWQIYETYMMIVVLILPAFIMASAYASISSAIVRMVVRRRSITGKGQMANGVLLLNGVSRANHKETEEAEVKQVVTMLVVVVLLFVLCWAPILVINVIKAYGIVNPYSHKMKHVVTAADLLSYCNSCINPIVYGFMSKNFRESFLQVLGCRKRQYRTGSIHLSVTRTSILRYNDSRIWSARSVRSRGAYPLNQQSFGYGRSVTQETTPPVIVKTTPSL